MGASARALPSETAIGRFDRIARSVDAHHGSPPIEKLLDVNASAKTNFQDSVVGLSCQMAQCKRVG